MTHTEWNIKVDYEAEDGTVKSRLSLPWRNEERMRKRFNETNWEGRTVHLVKREVTEWETVETLEHSGEYIPDDPDDYEMVTMQVPMRK